MFVGARNEARPSLAWRVTAAAAVSLVSTLASVAVDGQAPVAYTEAQATRGQAVYLQECAACHGRDLLAVTEFGAPPLAGDEFLHKWQGKTIGALFELTRATMPLDSPARLSRRQYADVLAYVLKTNGFRSGDSELTDDVGALQSMIVGNPPKTP